MNRVKDKVAIITGGACGLGRAQALMLAEEGAKIIVTDINVAEGKKVVEEIKNRGLKAKFIKHDVTIERNWEEVIERTLSEFGRLDVLVNNAGIFFRKAIEETSLAEWRRVISVNLDGVFLGTKHAVAAMKRSGGDRLLIYRQ